MRDFLACRASTSRVWRALGVFGLRREERTRSTPDGVETRIVMSRKGRDWLTLRTRTFNYVASNDDEATKPSDANLTAFSNDLDTFFADTETYLRAAERLIDKAGRLPSGETVKTSSTSTGRPRHGAFYSSTTTTVIKRGE